MTTLALPYLFDAVAARFAAEGTSVPMVFGWREPAQRPATLPRIAWVPGDDGKVGAIAPARQPGRNPRPLATLVELVTIYVEADDPAALTNERAQYIAARSLFDALYRAVYLAARGIFALVDLRWVDARKELRRGATLRAVFSIEAVLADEPVAVAPAGVRAVIDVVELDVTETIETAPAPAAVHTVSVTPITLSGEQTVDGVEVIAGDRVLVTAQSVGAQNGIYVAALGAWSRAADVLEHGFLVHDEAGDTGWALTTADPIVIDTTPLVFERTSP